MQLWLENIFWLNRRGTRGKILKILILKDTDSQCKDLSTGILWETLVFGLRFSRDHYSNPREKSVWNLEIMLGMSNFLDMLGALINHK